MNEKKIPGIIYYKKDAMNLTFASKGETVKVPIDYLDDCRGLLREKIRNKPFPIYKMIKNDHGYYESKNTKKERRMIDTYEKETLYLWAEDTEFLVKNGLENI